MQGWLFVTNFAIFDTHGDFYHVFLCTTFSPNLLHLSPSNYNQTAGMKLIENYHNMEERFAVFSGQTEDMLVFKVAIVNVVRLRPVVEIR